MKKVGSLDQLLDALNLDVELSPDQIKAMETLSWLGINGPMKSGRTMVMALCAIKTAMDNPGYRVMLVDHYPGEQSVMQRAIRRLLADAPEELIQKFQFKQDSITFQAEPRTEKVSISYNVAPPLHWSSLIEADAPRCSTISSTTLQFYKHGADSLRDNLTSTDDVEPLWANRARTGRLSSKYPNPSSLPHSPNGSDPSEEGGS